MRKPGPIFTFSPILQTFPPRLNAQEIERVLVMTRRRRGYTSLAIARPPLDFRRKLRAAETESAIGVVGDARNNAAAESLFATSQTELPHRCALPALEGPRMAGAPTALQTAFFHYVAVLCNRRRRHSTLGQLSPAEHKSRWNTHHESAMLRPTAKRSSVHEIGATPHRIWSYCHRINHSHAHRGRLGALACTLRRPGEGLIQPEATA